MLGGIFHKRKKSQELRSPSLQDLKKFRDAFAKYAELRQVDPPPCFEKSIYKAIAGQKDLHTVEFRQEDITDPQMIALAEALLEMPIVSSLDLRDNRITDDGAKALLEVLRLQIIAAKTPPTIDARTKQPLYPPLPEYTRREDKRLEIRAALNRIDRNSDGSIDEEEFKDFLESSEAMFDDNMAQDTKSAVAHSADDISNSLDYSPVPESILLASTTDITMDIQMNSSAQHTDDSPWNDDTVEDNGGAGEATIVTESGEVNSQNDAEYPIEVYDSKDHQPTKIGEVDEAPQEASPEATTAQSEDYDWLADSTDLSAECNEGDSFEHDMSAVSEDEVEGSAGQEQANPPLDDSWPNVDTTEPTMEEEVEVLDEAFNNNGDPNENEEAYETGEMVDNTDVAAEEDTEATENQYELGGGVDADDEEAETFGDWEKGFDPNSNHYFWFNHSTGESSWTPPEGWPHEVDEPFSADNEDATEDPGAAEEQPDRGYEEGTEGQEYEEGGVEGQDYSEEATEGHYYEEGVEGQEYSAEEQYYDESAAEGQYYEEGAEGQTYEDAAAEGQYYEEGAAQDESQEYDEGAVEDHAYDEGAVEEQQYDENTAADGQWYEETDAEGQEYATEDQKYEVATDEEQVVEQAGEESPRRSEVSDFEFDDSDLPGF
ncbi:Dynein assembly factor 1 [Phytophthora cinnamomi]|uniref:Dynein assembly factor 1 n=1 Tax=Phytophthora cinnamomi TaxID=4785 RepID=UPI00355A4B1D|nr:Dynein assembly factor 1 [Phytophthora cinnamomi]